MQHFSPASRRLRKHHFQDKNDGAFSVETEQDFIGKQIREFSVPDTAFSAVTRAQLRK